ncbi:MAG: polymorphic toxin type 50 domain-containing protein [Megasphaera micronuciformis]
MGYTVNKETGEMTRTSLATVHVSNKGIHIVPRKER